MSEMARRLATVLDPVWAAQESENSEEPLPELVDTGSGRVEDVPKLVRWCRGGLWMWMLRCRWVCSRGGERRIKRLGGFIRRERRVMWAQG
jgi:hypothetical protein